MTGTCGICLQSQVELHWLIRNRKLRHYEKRACLYCGIKAVGRVTDVYVEELPYVVAQETQGDK